MVKLFAGGQKKIAGDKITKLIKNCAVPSQSWDLCLCTVKYKCSSYEDSRSKCQEAAYLTFTEASSEEEISNQSLSDGHKVLLGRKRKSPTPTPFVPSPQLVMSQIRMN